MNTFSAINKSIPLSKDEYVISAVHFHSRRSLERDGLIGMLIIESLDEKDKKFAFALGFPFELGVEPEIHHLSFENDELISPKDFCRGKDCPSYSTYDREKHFNPTWVFKKNAIENNYVIANLLRTKDSIPKMDFSQTLDYSYRSAQNWIRKLGANSSQQFLSPNEPIIWNPFAREVIWNSFDRLNRIWRFPAAHVLSSSLWKRIKDTFFILCSIDNRGIRERVGILDYVFPFPRLLFIFAENNRDKVKDITQAALVLTAFALWSVQAVVAAILTIALLPIIGIVHVGIKLTSFLQEEHVTLKAINGELESINDLNEEEDFLPEQSLRSYAKLHNKLVIKPVKKTIITAQYEEIDISRQSLFDKSRNNPLDESKETLMLGVYNAQTKTIGGVIEITPKNHVGIFSLMKVNKYKIDSNLNKNYVMDNVLAIVKPKV